MYSCVVEQYRTVSRSLLFCSRTRKYRVSYLGIRGISIRFIRWIYGAASSPDVRGAAQQSALSFCYHFLIPATSASLVLPYARPGPTRANQSSPQHGQPLLWLARPSGHSGRAWNQRGSAAQLQGPTPTGGGHRASPNRASHLAKVLCSRWVNRATDSTVQSSVPFNKSFGDTG